MTKSKKQETGKITGWKYSIGKGEEQQPMKKTHIERLKTINNNTKVINNGHITTSTGQKIGYATIKRNSPAKKGRNTDG